MGSTDTPTIVCMGKAAQDVFLRDDEFDPHREGKVLYAHLPLGAKMDISEMHFTTGGNATNTAVTFARQGLHARYVWVLGSDDPASQNVLRDLENESVDTHYVSQIAGAHVSYSTIMLATNGERTILNYHGTVPRTTDVEELYSALDGANWVYPTSLGHFSTLESIVHEAASRGIKVMLNPAATEFSQPEKLKSLLHDIEVLCLNKEEMQELVEGDSIEELVRHGLNYCSVVIVSDGPNGVCASDGKTLVKAGMYEDVPVIDRLGAGDAFGSGFLSQWSRGASLRESIIFASANSTAVVQQIGGKAGILRSGTALHDMPITEEEL